MSYIAPVGGSVVLRIRRLNQTALRRRKTEIRRAALRQSLQIHKRDQLRAKLCENLLNMEFNESTLIRRVDETKLDSGEELTTRMTLHCQQCIRVLSDSFSICGEVKYMDCVMCLKVTNDVVVSESVELGHKGDMANCIYSSLECRGCRSAVGKVVHSAPSRLAAVRSIFLLHKANISCYILNRSSMVKASTVTFEMKPLTKSLDEVKQQFKAQLDHMSLVKSRLADRSVTREFNK